MVRALVIGAGEASCQMHLPVLAALRDQGRLELVEICDIRRDRAVSAAKSFGFARQSGDAASALAREDIDAAYLFADAWLHYELGLAALHNGDHLFVEKPVAPSYAEALQMAE